MAAAAAGGIAPGLWGVLGVTWELSMRCTSSGVTLCLVLGLVLPAGAEGLPPTATPAGVLAQGTRFATPYYSVDGAERGPTVVIVAGIHGNERAPPRAAIRILAWAVSRGRMIVVPEANPPALAARHRHTPRTRWLDLNRCFPTGQRPAPQGAAAAALWRFTRDLHPDWVLDLHEGYDFNRLNRKSMGSSVVYVSDERTQARTRPVAERVRSAVNATIDSERKHFTLLQPGPVGSYARSVTEQLGIPSLVLETTWPGQMMRLRVCQQLVMVRAVLGELGMVTDRTNPCEGLSH